MSKSASKFQEKFIALKFQSKEIFKPLNTGVIDEHVKCVREFVANVFFYTKNGTTIMIECTLVPGHTWGHMVYLIDSTYLFTGDTIWFDPLGGCSFLDGLAEDNALSMRSLSGLEALLRSRGLKPIVITGHTGWSDDLDFVFAHTDTVCRASKKQKPYDTYDESDDTREKAQTVRLKKVLPVGW